MNLEGKSASVVIASAQFAAVRTIRGLLAGTGWLRCIGECGDGPGAVRSINRLHPQLVFLDADLPGLDGFQVLDRLEYRPLVVFSAAQPAAAAQAFDVQALDFLVTPLEPRRVVLALQRANAALEGAMHSAVAAAPAARLSKVFVRAHRRLVPVDVADVTRFEASDDYVTLHLGDKQLLASIRMDDLEGRLDPNRFLRIHRSHIVSLGAVAKITTHASGRFLVTMRDGTRLMASRSRSRDFRRASV